MYKALYYSSQAFQAIMLLIVFNGSKDLFSAITSHSQAIVTEDILNILIIAFFLIVLPMAIAVLLRIYVDPKLKARFNPEDNVVEDRKE